MSYKNVRYSSRNTDQFGNLDELEREIEANRRSIKQSLRAGAEPVLSLPDSIRVLEQDGRQDEIDKLTSLTRSIASDVDRFTTEVESLDKRFDSLKRNRPSNPWEISKHYSKLATIGHEYLMLNSRILGTVMASIDTYAGIVDPDYAN